MSLAHSRHGFRAYLATQFLGAFNDNAFRFTLIFLVTASLSSEESRGRWQGLNQAVFAVPFIIFVALAGSVADRFSKSSVFRVSKLAEIAVMLAGLAAFAAGSLPALTLVLFCMATQSAFFGPAKYGLLAESYREGELVRANALVQLTTMLAIVGGQITGGWLFDRFEHDLPFAALIMVGIAALGTLTALFVPRAEPARPGLALVANPLPDVLATWRGVLADRTLLYTILGNAHYFLLVAALQINLADYGERGLMLSERAGAAALVATASVGLGLGSLLASRWSEGRVELGLVPLGALCMTVGLVLVAVVPSVPLDWLPPAWSASDADLGLLQSMLLALLLDGHWAPFGATLLLGLAGGLYVVPIWALLQQYAPENEKGRYLAFGNMVGFVGIALSGVLLWLPREWGWSFQAQFLLLAALALLGALVCLRLLPFAFVRLLGWLLAHTCYRIKVLNGERLPETGGVLLLVNHVSWVDALVLGTCTRRKVHFLMYRSYYEWWPTHWLFRIVGAIPVATGDDPETTARSLAAAGELLDQGRVVAVFGEGAVTRLGHLLPFRTGYQRIIEGRAAPIVPVYLGGLWGSVLSHQGGRFLRRLPRLSPRPVSVSFGHPLPSETEPSVARAAIQALAAEAVAQAPREPVHAAFARNARHDLHRHLRDASGLLVSPAGLLARGNVLAVRVARRLPAGARVALWAQPGVATAAVVLALLKSGRLPVLIDPELSDGAVLERARSAGATAWLTLGRVAPQGHGGAELALDERLCQLGRGAVRAALTLGLLRGLVPGRQKETGAEELAAVVFDADGAPCELTHRALAGGLDGLQQVLDLDRHAVVLGLQSWHHAYGLSVGLWLPLLANLGAAWGPTQLESRALGRLASRSRATLLFTDPVQLQQLVVGVRSDILGGVQLLVCARGKLTRQLSDAAKLHFGVRPSAGWAPDGCAGLAALNIPDVRQPGVFQRGTRPGTAGHPLPGVHVSVSGDAASAPQGSTTPIRSGRLILSGAPILREAAGAAGHHGHLDEDGFVVLE